MGKNGNKPVLQIRYRRQGKTFGTRFSYQRGGGKKLEGRILSCRKLSREQISRVGEYLPFDPKELLAEFNEENRINKREVLCNG